MHIKWSVVKNSKEKTPRKQKQPYKQINKNTKKINQIKKKEGETNKIRELKNLTTNQENLATFLDTLFKISYITNDNKTDCTTDLIN